MLDTITPGLEAVLVQTVTEQMGTGDAGPLILSTSWMVTMMEDACAQAVAGRLDSEETTVGTQVCVSYVGPCVPGEEVSVYARVIAHEIALDERMAVLLEHMLGERYLLTGYSANITAPGCDLQMLHQDQGYVNRPQPLYPIVTNVLWMLDEFTTLNGGTHVVPGSHLVNAPLADPPPVTVQLEGPAGTAAVVDGRTWHGAGANRSERLRHVLINNYCRAWVRQQWNPFLGLAPEVGASLRPGMRRLLGFKTWGTLGGVGQTDGIDAEGFVHRPERIITQLA
ncbi:MAG: mmcH [Ilumatobacteraceae bacterium]|nr:mmcH [Ilumatobacteraceae bacterium]